jgi:hypothetical protein
MKIRAATVALTLSLALAAGADAARRPVPLVEPARVELVTDSAKANEESVKNAIIAGGAEFEWVVVSSEPGKLRLKYNKQNKHEVMVDAVYDATGYQIKYVDSMNMQYQKTENGMVIHPFYSRWIDNMMKAIERKYTAAAQ